MLSRLIAAGLAATACLSVADATAGAASPPSLGLSPGSITLPARYAHGGVKVQRYSVTNTGTSPVRVRMSAVELSRKTGAEMRHGTAGRWVRGLPAPFTLKPGGRRIVKVRVVVPRRARGRAARRIGIVFGGQSVTGAAGGVGFALRFILSVHVPARA